MFIEISLQRYKNSGRNERKKRFFFIFIKQITENNRVFCTVEKQTHTTAKFGALQILKSQRQILKSQRFFFGNDMLFSAVRFKSLF